MFSPRHLVVPAVGSLLLFAAVGCESDNDDRDVRRDRRDRITDRRVDDSRYDRDRDYDRETRVDRDARIGDRDRVDRIDRRDVDDDDAVVAGARLSGIPRNARRVDSAQGTTEMMFRATRDATIYVYDADADRVVYTGTLRDGDKFVLDPNDNIALVNGKKVLDKDLKSRHVFRLYVLEDKDRLLY